MLNPNPINISAFRKYIVYHSLIKKGHSQLFLLKVSRIFKRYKKTWTLLYSIISSKKKSHSVPDIFTDKNQTCVGCSEIAEGFNDFFGQCGT